MRTLILVCLFCSAGACAHRSRQRVWWDEYGRFHGCRVAMARAVEVANRRGHIRERDQTCYVCPDTSTEYCFAGPPIGPPLSEAPPPPPPGGPPPGFPPVAPPPPGGY